jgi:hypothetical protein
MKKFILYMIILLSIDNYGYSQNEIGTENKSMIRSGDAKEIKYIPDKNTISKSCSVAVVITYSNAGSDEQTINRMIEKEFGSNIKSRVILHSESGEKPGIPGSHVRRYSVSYALEYAKKHSADFVLYGSIDRTVQGFKKPLDTDGEYPYLIKVAKNESYYFNLTLYNAYTNDRIKTFTEKTGRKRLNNTVNKMTRVFGPFLKADGVHAADRKIRTRPDVELSLFGAGILPIGRFTRIIKGGCGAGVNLGLSNLFMKNESFILSSKYYFYSYAGSGTISFSLFDIMLFFGISVPLAGTFRLVPLIGGGCQFSYARFNKLPATSLNRYVNPLVSVRLEGDIELVKRLIIFIVPEISVFFERKNVGMYAGTHIGLKYIF